MKFRLVPVAALLIASPAAGQEMRHGEHAGNHMVAAVRMVFDGVKNNLVRAAEQMPEEHYAFKPTEEVRSFAAMIGHIANSSYSYCSGALGEENPNKANIEQTVTTKAGLVQALRDAMAFCDRAYQVSDEHAMQMNGQRPRMWALVQNTSHDNEHYGNIVTYMRMKGLVPPSSQRGQ